MKKAKNLYFCQAEKFSRQKIFEFPATVCYSNNATHLSVIIRVLLFTYTVPRESEKVGVLFQIQIQIAAFSRGPETSLLQTGNLQSHDLHI